MKALPPIRLGHVDHSEAAVAAAVALIREGRTTEGAETWAFERELAAAMGYRRAVACSSGTAALWLVLSRMQKDEVVTTPLTYAATANAPESLGFKVRYVDVTLQNYGMDPIAVSREGVNSIKLTVHLFGYPSSVAGDVSDACEAVGADLPKPRLATAVSFYPSHTLGVGELGAVLTDSIDLAGEVRLAKDNGRDRHSDEPFRRHLLGLNFKASEITCALARYQLRRLRSIVGNRRASARAYTDLLEGKVAKAGPFDRRCAYLGYPVVLATAGMRQAAMRRLAMAGVECRAMFPLLAAGDFLYAEWVSACGLYLPCHQGLSGDDVHRAAEAVLG